MAMAESKCGGAASASAGVIWCMGWLFTIGYAHLMEYLACGCGEAATRP